MKKRTNNIFIRFIKEFALTKKNIWQYIVVLILIVIYTANTTIAPQFKAKLIDILSQIHQGYAKQQFIRVVLYYIILYSMSYVFDYFRKMQSLKIAEDIAANVREKMNIKLERVSVEYFDEKSSSDVISKVNKELTIIKRSGVLMFITLINNVFTMLVIIPIMFKTDFFMTLVSIILLMLYLCINKRIGLYIQKNSEQNFVSNENMITCFDETFNNWLLSRIYETAKFTIKRFQEYNTNYKKSCIKLEKIYLINYNFSIFILLSSFSFIWISGGLKVISGTMSLGMIILMINYQNLLFSPIQYISTFINEYNSAKVAIERLYEFLDYKNEFIGKIDLKDRIQKVEYNDVDFSYGNKEVLKDCSIEFKKGIIYGITGTSGSGKSTFIKLLLNLKTPTSGKILINDIDLKNIKIKNYRMRIGYVSSNSTFYSGTIKENLNMNYNYDINNIIQLCNDIDIYTDIEKMEQGLDTFIQIGHSNLSEGQARRIDIVRSMLKEPDIVIFDEATSALDSARRQKVYQYIHKIKKEKIVIIISHNNDEKKCVDESYYISNGKLFKGGELE